MPIVQDRDGRGIAFPAQYGLATSLGERLQHDYRFRAAISARLRAQSTQPEVSMGPSIDRRDLPIQSGRSVLGLDEQATYYPSTTFSRSDTRTMQTSNRGFLSAQQAQDIHNPRYGGPRMALDLGSIVQSLGEQYITTRWGADRAIMVDDRGPLGGGRVAPIPPPVGADVFGRNAIRTTPVWALPAAGSLAGKIGGILGGLGLGLGAAEIAEVAGAISKVKCKRRRRRLATHSDIKDLAALSAVLGKGKLLETWVATRRI